MKSLIFFIILKIVFCDNNELKSEDLDNFTEDRDAEENTSDGIDGLNKLFEVFKKKKGNYQELFTIKNPDIKRLTPEIIESRGFQFEEHTVVTDDDYILGIFRIINPYVRPSSRLKSVLLWHQLNTNSKMWLISNPGFLDRSGRYSERNGTLINNCRTKLTSNVAFTLAACGYDVWLGNTRGNIHSPGHKTLSSSDEAFSNYTFTELGVYDTKNTVQYILKKTNTSCIGYLGSSQGSTQVMTLLSLIPKFEKYLSPIILMPPIMFLGNTTSVIRYGTPLVPLLNDLTIAVGGPVIVNEAMAQVCSLPFIQQICISLTSAPAQNIPSLLTEPSTSIASISIGGNYVSSKILLQYGQFMINGRFNQFDFMNPETNYQFYGQPEAPDYPIHKITSRNIVLFRGPNDALCRKGDLDHFISKMKVPPLDVYVIPNPQYNHVDFLFATNNNQLIMKRIMQHLSGRNPNTREADQ